MSEVPQSAHDIEVEGLSLKKAAEEFGFNLVHYVEGKVEQFGNQARVIEGIVRLERSNSSGTINFIGNTVEHVLTQLHSWLTQHQPITGADQSKDALKPVTDASGNPVGPPAPIDDHDTTALGDHDGDADDAPHPPQEPVAATETPAEGADEGSAGRKDVVTEEPAAAAPEGTVEA